MWGTLSDERTGVLFTIAAVPRKHSYSWVRVPYFSVSDLRLPQPGGPGPCIYIPQEQGGPLIHPGIGFTEQFTSSLTYNILARTS
jgi:hypothetical protein